jgi:23S rRNA (uridine2552-2'-O)-methyltransferase
MARRPKRRHNPYAKPDALSLAAKAAGYTARSVFKLEQIDQRVHLLRQGQHVLDLGAAPGSWSAYAAKRIGGAGQLVAIDLKPLIQALPKTCQVITGDAFDGALLQAGPIADVAPYQVVLSDMAPNTTGDKATDQIRSHQLFMRALELATDLLEPGGSFVGKLFMGGEFGVARDALRARFATVRTIRPKAVRDVSSEIYLVGLSLKS